MSKAGQSFPFKPTTHRRILMVDAKDREAAGNETRWLWRTRNNSRRSGAVATARPLVRSNGKADGVARNRHADNLPGREVGGKERGVDGLPRQLSQARKWHRLRTR